MHLVKQLPQAKGRVFNTSCKRGHGNKKKVPNTKD